MELIKIKTTKSNGIDHKVELGRKSNKVAMKEAFLGGVIVS